MSVIVEKDKIIITIPTNNPEGELHNIQKNIIDILSSLHPDYDEGTYWAYWLVKEMIPDKNTFKAINADIEKGDKVG